MNQLIQNKVSTMTSIEFLDAVINPFRTKEGETPHEPRKFLAKIIDELDLDETGKKFRLNNNQTESAYYTLDKDQMMLVGMRESKAVRKSVLEWIKLATEDQKPAIPQTYAAALLEAGRLALENEKQAEQLRLASPKVEFVDKFVSASTGSMGFREVAKLLKIKEPEFRLFLSECNVMYLLGSNYVPYQCHIEAGRFEIKAGVSDSDHAYKQAKFTAKGVEWIAGEYAKYKINKQLESAKCQKEQ